MSILRCDVGKIRHDEIERSQKMLERLALNTAPHQFTQRRQFRFSQFALEFQIKLHARSSQHIRHQMLCVQTRTLDVVLLEIRRRRLKHFKNGHTYSSATSSVI